GAIRGVRPLEAARRSIARVRVASEVGSDLVVALALRGIGEHFVRFVDLLEALLRSRGLVHVRVVLPGELSVRLLDVLSGRVLRNAEDLVVVLVLDRHTALPLLVGRWGHRRARCFELRRSDLRLPRLKGDLEYLVDLSDRLDLDGIEDFLRDVDEIPLVLLREDEGLDARAVSGEQLLLHAADGKDAAAQGDLSGHRDVATYATAGKGRHDRGRHGDAGRRTVLRDRSRGDVDVHGVVLEEPRRDAELGMVRAHVAERGPRRLLHDLPDLAGEHEVLVLAVDDRGLDGEDVTAVLAHRDAGDGTDLVLFLGESVIEPLRPEVFGERVDRDLDLLRLALGDGARDLAADRPDLPLEVADARLAGVA